MGFYWILCGGMVTIVCMSGCLLSGIVCGIQSVWFIINIVMVFVSSLAAILAQCMASVVVLWSVGNARLVPFYLEEWACPSEPNIMSRVCGELYCVSWIGHVSGDE